MSQHVSYVRTITYFLLQIGIHFNTQELTTVHHPRSLNGNECGGCQPLQGQKRCQVRPREQSTYTTIVGRAQGGTTVAPCGGRVGDEHHAAGVSEMSWHCNSSTPSLSEHPGLVCEASVRPIVMLCVTVTCFRCVVLI